MFAKALIVLLLLMLVGTVVYALRRKDQSLAFKVMAVVIALALGSGPIDLLESAGPA